MFFILNSVFFFTLGSFYWKTVIRLPVGNRNLEQMFRSTFFLGFCSLLLSVRHFAKVIARRAVGTTCRLLSAAGWANTLGKLNKYILQIRQTHWATTTNTLDNYDKYKVISRRAVGACCRLALSDTFLQQPGSAKSVQFQAAQSSRKTEIV